MTVNRLADRLRSDADVVAVARLLRRARTPTWPTCSADHRRRARAVPGPVPLQRPRAWSSARPWERTWDLQREEDATGQRLDIPVPPEVQTGDFLRPSYWRHRGKLDVPKERFISYPDASPDSDGSLLLGWAGWDHREQAQALITLIEERSATDGWGAAKLIPLLAGLLEVMPWVRQWHNEVDDAFGASPAYEYDTYLTSQREKYGLTEDDLRAWAPPKPARGRRRKS